MQQFWFIIEKVKRTSYYKFEIDHKTCQIDVDTFKKILNLTLNVEKQDFIQPPSSDDLKEFLLNLGYTGKLPSISEIHVDHMHQPWRTFRAIIKKCFSYKGQKTKIMPYPRFTKVIIHYFMSQHKSISKREGSPYHTVTDDGLLDKLKFVSKGNKYQVYGKPILDALITDDIKNSKTYKMFFKYLTSLIPPKKSRATNEPATPKKTTTSSKKKITKRKLVLIYETKDEEDLEHRSLSRKKRIPKTVFIQEPPSAPVKQTYESSDENPKSPPSDLFDNDDLNEFKDHDDERVETDDDDDDEIAETDDDCDDEEEEVDRSTNIKSDDEHQGKGDADMNIKQEVEKEMSDEKHKEGNITSIKAVPIQQDVPTIVPEPLHAVIMTVIPDTTQVPPPPTTTTLTLVTQVSNTEAVSFVVQRFSKMEQFVKQLKETNFKLVIHDSITSQVPSIVDKYFGSSLPDACCKEFLANNAALKKELSELNCKEVIKESVKAHVVKEFKNFLPQSLPKAVSDFATPIIKESVKAHAVNEDVIEESVKAYVVNKVKNFLPHFLPKEIKLDESKSTRSTKHDQIPKKRDCSDDDQYEDPFVGSNQCKQIKKRRIRKETESSNKSSTPKESTKGKPTSKPSKYEKSRSANDTVEETVFEMGSDDVDQTFEKKADDSEQPSPFS
nr:hypothetical protein [Tanacetum cinerariifolium]